MSDDTPSHLRTAAGVILVVTGVIWILQGLDVAFAPRSFMTDDRQWVVWGLLALASGAGLVYWDRRSS